MGICDSSNKQPPVPQNTLTPPLPQDTRIPTPQNTLSKSRRNNLLNSEQNINQINQFRQNMNNENAEDRPSNINRYVSLGSSINMNDDDSVDNIQTRPTYVTNNNNS